MASMWIKGYLVNKYVFPDYEISPGEIIRAFIGDDTGAPLRDASLTIETDDGYTVYVSIDPGDSRPGRLRAATMNASVSRRGSEEG